MNKESAPGLSYLTINALIWGAAILGGSYVFKDIPRYDLILAFSAVGYSVSNAFIYYCMKQHGYFDKNDQNTSHY
ncbi:MAG: hypothetical protein ACO3M5_03860 [Saprospiraceae bacterium]|jgi:hypothetical protein